MRNFALATRLHLAVLLALAAPGLGACPDPNRHPGLALFNDIVESWGTQPEIPVEMRFKLHDAPRVGLPVEVELSYWPFGPYSDGRLAITPSDGVELVDSSVSADLPNKGSHRFTVRPIRKGYHYVQVENSVVVNGETIRRLAAIPLAVEVDHEDGDVAEAPSRFDFAGPRLRSALGIAGQTPPGILSHER